MADLHTLRANTNARRRPLAAAIAVATLLGAASAPASALENRWLGTHSTYWNDPANWSRGVSPGGDQQVVVDAISPNPALLDSGNFLIGTLRVGDAASGAVTMDMGGTLRITASDNDGIGLLLGASAGSQGEMTIHRGGTVLTVDQTTQIGGAGNGTLRLTGGATANLGLANSFAELYLGMGAYTGPDAGAGSGTVVVDGDGSTLNYAGGFNVANGSLTVSQGGQLASHDRGGSYTWLDMIGVGWVASSPSSQFPVQAFDGHGVVTITDAGSRWNSVNGLGIGDGGTGLLSILNGATAGFQGFVQAGYTRMTYDVGTSTSVAGSKEGDGAILVSGQGSALAVTAGRTGDGNLSIGGSGKGSLAVDDQGAVDVAGQLILGDQAKGIATVSGGGTLTIHGHNADGIGSTLGYAADSEGGLTVGGAGSTLVVGAGTQVGRGGHGSLAIQQGGTANLGLDTALAEIVAGLGYYGWGGAEVAQGSGAIAVDGAGSTLNYAGGLNVLNGTLAVSGGGRLASRVRAADQGAFWLDVLGYGLPADGATFPEMRGAGKATVAGAGSQWSSVNGLHVGEGGDGSLEVLDGGTASFLGEMVLGGTAELYDLNHQPMGLTRTGSGSVRVAGAGSRLTLAAADDTAIYRSGQLIVGREGDGTLQVDDHGAFDASGRLVLGDQAKGIAMVSAGGTLAVHGSDADGIGALLGHAATGAGWLTVDGTGSVFTVDTRMQVGSAGQGVLTIRNGAGATVAGGIDVGARGSVMIGGLDAQGHPFLPGLLDTPSLALAASPQAYSLVFQHAEDDYKFTPAITGHGSIDVASGFTMLTGDSSAFAGHVDVQQGATLSVNGNLGGDLDVLPGGRLQGTGTVNNVTVDGTLAPGNSPGTLNVAGDLWMRSGSIYEAQIDPAAGTSDSVRVAGNVTIEPGSKLEVQNIGNQPLTPGMQIELLQASGDVQGQFDNVEGEITAFLGYDVSYRNGQLVLDLTRSPVSFASVAGTPQVRALGAALDSVPAGGSLGQLLYGQLSTTEQAAATFQQMADTLHPDLRRVMLDNSRLTRDALEQRLWNADADTQATTWWVHALGDWNRTNGPDGLANVRSDSSGSLVGVDAMTSDATRLGIAAGLGRTSYRALGQNASAHTKDRHLALYGSSTTGHFDIGYGLGLGWHSVSTRRSYAVGTAPQQLVSDSNARTGQAFVDVGYRMGDDANRRSEPFLALAHVRLHSGAAHEHGAVTRLDIAQDTSKATFGTAGWRWSVATGAARWSGMLGWRHAFSLGRATAQEQFAEGGQGFAMQGLPMLRNAAQVGLDASFKVGRHARASFGYEGLFAGSSRSHGARAQLAISF
ncbi:autotransporter domain-containing protein [Frateuria sp. Soil773]|uniref:autotransporter domain-containing protein n=1 Tax=Frateuria sp. Soil773 TaxID=1736407 RepID=UPI00138F51B9|nr:autotransporter domain-containing protein [Frateuria sp. Soil773]